MDKIDISSSNIHFLAFPFPAKGHINPMLHLCNRLASKGFKITLVTTVSTCKAVKTKATSLISIESIPDGVDLDEASKWNVNAYFTKFRMSAIENMTQLIQKHKGSANPPKVAIYDSAMPWMLDVAQGLGLLGASFFTQSCSVCAIYYHMLGDTIKTQVHEPTISLPCLPPLECNDLPGFDFFGDHKEFMEKISLDQFSNIDKADYILFNTFDKLEREVANWMESKWPILTVGPTIPSMLLDKQQKEDGNYLFETNTEVCLKWLDEREIDTVVYVSFGSLASLTKDQMEEVAQGLMRSNRNFLWVVRDEEKSKLSEELMRSISEKGFIINWCPQLDVLAHRAVACFMTHCGWNSILEALSSGIPMIAMPLAADQTTNAKFIADVWEAGVRVKFNEDGIFTREEIKYCIREVIETERGQELRGNAIKWKGLAKEAVSEGGSSHRNIEEFASSILLR